MAKNMVNVFFTALAWTVAICFVLSNVGSAYADDSTAEKCNMSTDDFNSFGELCDECSKNYPSEVSELCRSDCFSSTYFGQCVEQLEPGMRKFYEDVVKEARGL